MKAGVTEKKIACSKSPSHNWNVDIVDVSAAFLVVVNGAAVAFRNIDFCTPAHNNHWCAINSKMERTHDKLSVKIKD